VSRQIDRFVPLRIRAAALMPAAVLAVHQLRYQLAFGGRVDGKLALEGHGYLGGFAPLAAMLIAIAVGMVLATMAQAWRRGAGEGENRSVSSFRRVWLLAAVSLLVIYCGQELLEGFLASGHPGGIAGVFGQGGLWAIPLSFLLGAVVALGLRVAEIAVRWAAERRVQPQPCRAPRRLGHRPGNVFLVLREPLAGAAAGRAPPALPPLIS
jgi:hypothetical protein